LVAKLIALTLKCLGFFLNYGGESQVLAKIYCECKHRMVELICKNADTNSIELLIRSHIK